MQCMGAHLWGVQMEHDEDTEEREHEVRIAWIKVLSAIVPAVITGIAAVIAALVSGW